MTMNNIWIFCQVIVEFKISFIFVFTILIYQLKREDG